MLPSDDEVATVEAMRGLAEWIDFLSYVLNKHKIFKDLKPSRDRRAVPSPASTSRIDLL